MELISIIFAAVVLYYIYSRCKSNKSTQAHAEPLDSTDWIDPGELEFSNPRPIDAHLRIKYCDATGTTTTREVHAKECDTTNSNGYLIGICQIRQAIRTFRIDRIMHAIDLDSGEVIEDIPAYATQRYLNSPGYAIENMLSESSDALRALFYIGKADGRFTQKEKQIFLSFCHEVSGNQALTINDIEKACNLLTLPSMQAYKIICGRLAKLSDAKKAAIQKAAIAMIETEKTISPEERQALEYMNKKLFQNANPA